MQCLSNCQFGSSVDWRLATLDGRQQTRDPAACALLKVFGSWQRIVRTHTHTQSTRIAVDHLTRCRCLQLESTVRMAAATKSNKRFAQKCHKPNGSAAIYENVRTTVHAPCPEVQVTVLMSFYSFAAAAAAAIYLFSRAHRERERAFELNVSSSGQRWSQ